MQGSPWKWTQERGIIKLCTYTGPEDAGLYKGYSGVLRPLSLPLLIIDCSGLSLLGMDWLSEICLNWTPESTGQHNTVFRIELGFIRGTTAKTLLIEKHSSKILQGQTCPLCFERQSSP